MSYNTSAYSEFALAEGALRHATNFSGPVEPTSSLNLVDMVKEHPPAAPPDKMAPPSPFTQLAQFLKSLPENQKVDTKTLLEAARGTETYPALVPVLDGSSNVSRSGNHVQIDRSEVNHIPIGRNILEGNASADSLNIEKQLTFDIAPDGKSVNDVQGLSVSVSAFGTDKAIPVRKFEIPPAGNNNQTIVAHIDNPLPANARDILSMPSSLSIPLETANGLLKLPQASSLFHAVAASAGNTLPGMLFSDAFQDLGDISQFAEKNPKWIHDVIKPMFEEVKKQATQQPTPKTEGNNGGQKSNGKDVNTGEEQDATGNDKSPENSKPAQITKSGDYDKTIVVDGRERQYSLHVPPNYDGSKPIPLVLMLHGRGGDGKEFAQRTHMNEKADKEGFAVVYPNATKWLGRKDLSAWDAANGLVPPGGRSNDLQFLREVIERNQADLNIDPKRIHMIGHSSGGMMTYLAASQLSDKLASVGVVSAAMSGKEPKPDFPISVISTHGTNDEVIPINGLQGVPPILSELGIPTFNTPQFATDFWKRQNGITSAGTTNKDGDITRRHFQNTQNRTAVEELILEDSGHTPDEKFHVYDKIWDFLAEHPKSSGQVAPSNDPTVLTDDRSNPLRPIINNIQKRGADGIAEDVAKIYSQVARLPDGSIYPSQILNGLEQKIGSELNNPFTDFIENSDELSKNGNHVRLTTSQPINFPINESASVGTIDSLSLDNVRFDLDTVKGNPRLSNIDGISLSGRALGQDFTTKLNNLTDIEDDKGRHTYNFNLDNPVPKPLRLLMFSPSTVDVGMQVDDNGDVKIANQREVKNDLLGRNPVIRGYIDEIGNVSQLISQPTYEAALQLRRDVGITAGLTTLGAFAPRYKIAASLAGGLLAAPAVIHFMHEKLP